MNPLQQYLDWLAAAEDVLAEQYTVGSLPDIESLLERILWRLTSSFLTGPFAETEQRFRSPDSIIKYFGFPLFSHYKEINRDAPYWLNKYPIFFGQRDDLGLCDVITRYAFLYRGLVASKPHFSLTGFASNMTWGLSHPPQYLFFEMRESPTGSAATAELITSQQVFGFVCQMPPAPDISHNLSSVHSRALNELAHNRHGYPIIGCNFSADMAPAFWKSFEAIADACGGLEEAIHEIEKYADAIELALKPQIENNLELRDNNKQSVDWTARNLARFIARNYVLGFRNIIYCPYRIAEPFYGESRLVSWGGAILVLSDATPISATFGFVNSHTIETETYTPRKYTSEHFRELVTAMRLFVEVATPKVIFGDWKYYQRTLERTTINKFHAELISQGLGHELRVLQTIVSLHVSPQMREKIAIDLEVSAEIARLVWKAHIDRDRQLSLSELLEMLRGILRWKTLVLEDNVLTSGNSHVLVPFPLLYVLAELCRNAYKFSRGDPTTTPRVVVINFTVEQGTLSAVRILNHTERQHPPINCDRLTVDDMTSKILGLTMVMRIVCDVLSGTFSFQISKGQAIASVILNSPTLQ